MNSFSSFSFCTLFYGVLFFLLSQNTAYGQGEATKIDSLLEHYYQGGKFVGVALVSDGSRIMLKRGFGLANRDNKVSNKPHTIFRIASITKQFTAVLVMQLVETRQLALDGKISDYLPGFSRETGSLVSIHQLLTHTSGIPEFNCPGCSLLDTLKKKHDVQDLVQRFGGGDLLFEPGTKFQYSNMDYLILGAIIEKVTGKKWENLLAEKILKPLNLTSTGMDYPGRKNTKNAQGYFKQGDVYYSDPEIYMPNLQAAASMYSDVMDVWRWSQALYAKPNVLLSQKSLELMFGGKDKPLFHLGFVGYSTWVYQQDLGPDTKVTVHERRGEVGGFHCSLVRVVDRNQAVILLSNVGTNESVGTLYEITSKIVKIINNVE